MTTGSFNHIIQQFALDPEFVVIDKHYEPYFLAWEIDDSFETFDLIDISADGKVAAKLIWHNENDLPTDLKRDVKRIFDKHFNS